jgi:hypothetical protein
MQAKTSVVNFAIKRETHEAGDIKDLKSQGIS